jgi:peptidoglycan/LPS O-acetylase OafA/YrhL
VTAPATSPDSRRLPVLDGIRAIAIALVLCGHTLWETPLHVPALRLGYLGVSIFFVLSGFLITRILLAEEARTGRVRLRRFYERRALRIFPALYSFLAVLAILAWIGAVPTPDHSTWTACLLYFRNYAGAGWETAHLWTLALEGQFYLFWPPLFVLIPKHHRFRAILAAVALFTLWRMHVLTSGQDSGLYSLPTLRSDTFLIGGAFAIADRTFVKDRTAHLFASGLVLWSIVGLLYFGAIDTPVSALLIGGLITWLAQSPRTPLAILLSRPAPVLIGVLSYSIYLWQQLFLGPRLHWWSLPALALAVSISYFVIEKPVLRLKSAIA